MKEPKLKTSTKAVDRIILHLETANRLNRWMDELSTRYKGLRISRTDLANHLLLSRSETLTHEEAESIRNQYFDEVSFAAWVLKEVRAAKARGEAVSIADLYGGLTQPSKPRRTRKPSVQRHFEETSVSAGTPYSETQHGEGESEVL